MFLTVPPDRLFVSESQHLLSGTAITIDLTPAMGDRLGYTVTVRDTSYPAAPSSVTLAGIGKRATFVNTGVRFLNRFDYRFDADGGTVGYRPSSTP